MAVEEFRRTAKQLLAEGMRPALDQATSELRERMHEIAATTRQLEHHVLALNALHTATAWKAFVASAVASLAIIGVAGYMGIQTHREVQHAHWDGAVNAAIAPAANSGFVPTEGCTFASARSRYVWSSSGPEAVATIRCEAGVSAHALVKYPQHLR